MNYNKLKDEIKLKKISIRQLCIKIGISEQGYYKMIGNKTMTVKNLESICELLKVSPCEFFNDSPYYRESILSLASVSENKEEYKTANKAEIESLTKELKIKDEMIELYRKLSEQTKR